jgi:hypothetical protein
MSKRKEPDSGCSPVDNRLTRSRSSPMLNESSFEIEALNDSNSADSAQTVDANRSSASPFNQQSPRNSTPIPPGNLISLKCVHAYSSVCLTVILKFCTRHTNPRQCTS